jgi:hypothetical protein
VSDAALFAQALELGRLLGWHDGSGRSRHQEYANASRRKRRRVTVESDDQALIRHADALNKALFAVSLAGDELAELVVEQQRDDKPWIRRPRNVLGFDEPAAILAMQRRVQHG